MMLYIVNIMYAKSRYPRRAKRQASKPAPRAPTYRRRAYVPQTPEELSSPRYRRQMARRSNAPPAVRNAFGAGINELSAIPRSIGNAAGYGISGIADFVGSKLGSIFGQGDYVMPGYTPAQNSLVLSGATPQVISSIDREFNIRFREYIGDVTTGAANTFSITEYPIQPGLPDTFPWLSQVAANFEQYRINGMIFEFKSLSADALNSTNTALGSVIMATEYNSVNSGFTSKQQMENHEFSVSAKQSCSVLHPIECKRSQTPVSELYVRNTTPASNSDLRLYDLGKFYIATSGQQATAINIGELWVTYDVTFLKPNQAYPILSAGLRNSITPTTSNHFGTASIDEKNSMSVLYTAGATSTLNLGQSKVQFGHYAIWINWDGTGITTQPTITLNSSFETSNWLIVEKATNGAGTNTSAFGIVNIIDDNPTISFTGGWGGAPSMSTARFMITRLQDDIDWVSYVTFSEEDSDILPDEHQITPAPAPAPAPAGHRHNLRQSSVGSRK